MDLVLELVGEDGVDEAVAVDLLLAPEALGHDFQVEVSLAAARISSVAAVGGALIP